MILIYVGSGLFLFCLGALLGFKAGHSEGMLFQYALDRSKILQDLYRKETHDEVQS